jgi:diacylglycerol kinase family enzyme
MNNLIIINEHSGSFDANTLHYVIQCIKHKFNLVEKHISDDTYEMINQKNNENINTLFIFVTRHINHAKELSSLIYLDNFHIIFIVGGDGMIHEIVNGMNHNKMYSNKNILLSVIPFGSGNHLSKSLNIHSIDEWYNSLDKMQIMKVFPTIVHTHDHQQILSINTIIGGLPKLINSNSTYISKYIPRFAGWLKYDLSTLYSIFLDFDNIMLQIGNNDESSIHYIAALFIQTTQSCGSNFIISTDIKPDQTNISLSYFLQQNKFRLLYEIIKEKFGYQSKYMLRYINKHNVVYVRGSHLSTITIDGQNEKIHLDSRIMIKKSLEYFNFIHLA